MKDLCQLFRAHVDKFLIALVLLTSQGFTKVDPPNYNFTLDKFTLFFPGSKLAEIEKAYPKKELLLKNGSFRTYKFSIIHSRYKFPILVQVQEGIVTDFHTRLPTYFLHDLFHQSLINRYGKQDKYKNNKEQSIYQWINEEGRHHTYVGACTITCFPIYYSVKSSAREAKGDYKPILDQLLQSETKQLPDS